MWLLFLVDNWQAETWVEFVSADVVAAAGRREMCGLELVEEVADVVSCDIGQGRIVVEEGRESLQI